MGMRLDQLLPPEACHELTKILNSDQAVTHIDEIKAVTRRYAAVLESKGVDADYLAYAILYAAQKPKPSTRA